MLKFIARKTIKRAGLKIDELKAKKDAGTITVEEQKKLDYLILTTAKAERLVNQRYGK